VEPNRPVDIDLDQPTGRLKPTDRTDDTCAKIDKFEILRRAMPTEDEYSEDEQSGSDEEEEVKSGDISDDDDQADSDQACLSSLLLVYMFAAAVFRCLVTV
jgi:hypothetical protein